MASQELFDPKRRLFSHSATENVTFQINPNAAREWGDVCGDLYRIIGRLLGKAVLDGQLVSAFFNYPLLKVS